MGELGELLELLYGARLRYRTARGTLVHRHSNALMRRASLRHAERSRARGSSVSFTYASGAGEEPPDVYAERLRFWWQPPDRLREEVESDLAHQNRTSVHVGPVWWLYRETSGALSNADLPRDEQANHRAGGGERFRPLLDPSGLGAVLDLGDVSETGDLLRVRARLRDDLDLPVGHHLHLVWGADEYELDVDRRTGVLRRVAAFLDGAEVASTALEELVLDEDFPPDTFVFVPPPGVEVLPPEPFVRRSYTLEEAAAEAPFRVFAVPELPEGSWRLTVMFAPARGRPPHPAHLHLHYHRGDGRGSLGVAQRPAGAGAVGWAGIGPPDLEQVERGGVELTIARGDPERGGQNGVALERDGTAVQLQSQELDVETLVELALALRPVSAA